MGLESFYVAPLEAIFECRMERRVQFRKQDEMLSAHQALVAPSVVERHNPIKMIPSMHRPFVALQLVIIVCYAIDISLQPYNAFHLNTPILVL